MKIFLLLLSISLHKASGFIASSQNKVKHDMLSPISVASSPNDMPNLGSNYLDALSSPKQNTPSLDKPKADENDAWVYVPKSMKNGKENSKGLTPDMIESINVYMEQVNKRVQMNIDSDAGEVEKREYLVFQAVLVLCIVLGQVLFIEKYFEVALGPGMLFCGLYIIALAALELDTISPFSTPPESKDQLKTEGIYAQMRHPFYCGIVLFLGGKYVVFIFSLLY